MIMSTIPKQRIPLSDKDKEWGKKTIEALIERASFTTKDNMDLQKLYDAYNGIINQADYSFLVNPYNTQDERFKRFPAELRNYNIIKPVVDLLIGEKAKRPFDFQVVVKNPDAVDRREQHRQQMLKEYMTQLTVNALNEEGVPTGMPSKPVPPPEEVKKQAEITYRDARAIMGQEALDYLVDDQDIFDKHQTGFFDWIVTGRVASYKGVAFGDVDYEIESPLDIYYEASPDTDYLEDADFVVCRKVMSINQIVDSFYDLLSEEDIDHLENPTGMSREGVYLPFLSTQPSSDRQAVVEHAVWKSFDRIGILTYQDQMGQTQEMVVEEPYTFSEEDGDIDLEWYWVNRVWEGYRIDEKIFVGIQPFPVQRNEMGNLSTCKLPYNGRVYSGRNSTPVSLVMMGMVFQKLYNIFHYRLELSVAKNKDKIALMEINTVPKRHGWTEDKFMYYADALGFAWIDSTAEGKSNEKVTFNQFQVLDMSLGKYIEAQFNLLAAVKQEWEDMLGINRQRKGQAMATDKVGSNERAVFQSSMISEELFRRFEKWQEKELQGLLDVSKVAWKDGKKASYVTSDRREAILNIDGDEYMNTEFGVFVKNAGKEKEKLESLRSLTAQFAQQGSTPSTVAEILDAGNFTQLKELLKEVEATNLEMQQATQQAEAENEQALEQMRAQLRQEEMAFEASENQKNRETQIYIAELNNSAKLTEAQMDRDFEDNYEMSEVEKQKMDLEKKKFEHQVKKDEKELAIKEKAVNKKSTKTS